MTGTETGPAGTARGAAGVEPVAEVALSLVEDVRSKGVQATDVSVGHIRFHSWQVELAKAAAHDEPRLDAYLVRAHYDVDCEPDVPPPLWAEVEFGFDAGRSGGPLVSAALPGGVTVPEPARTHVLTSRLDFAAGDEAGDEPLVRIPFPALAPDITVFGVGSPAVRWRHTGVAGGSVRLGSHLGCFVLLVPAGRREIDVRARAGYALSDADAMGMTPTAGSDVFTVRLPRHGAPAAGDAAATSMRLGFTLDIVGYSKREVVRDRRALHARLDRIVRDAVDDIGHDLDDLDRQPTGDGIHVALPVDADPLHDLPALIGALHARLTADNHRHTDRIRLRMAADFGSFLWAELGFEGDLVLSFSRLVDSAPVREAVVDNPQADLVLLVSEFVYQQAVRAHPVLSTRKFTRVEAHVKGYQAPAWLCVPGVGGLG
ncbi:hypothetical protein ACH44C_12320 [Streptomyces purpureus]|uniref:hypothetical protein n=1 Tax=Streptomyces purpureus TaxID=1951 RepID=UPI001319EF39|nr:hypothetical protein [Streptomyces purpureus]